MKQNMHLIRFGMTVVLVVLLNFVGGSLFFRADSTKYQVFSVTNESRRLIKSLKEPLTIKAFFTGDLPTPYNNLKQELQDLMNAYSVVGNSKFNFSIKTLSAGAAETSKEYVDFTEDTKQYQIYPVQIQSYENEEVKLSSVYKGLVIIHGSITEVISDLGADLNLEYVISSRIRKIADKTTAMLSFPEKIRVSLYYSSYFQGKSNFSQLVDLAKKAVDDLNSTSYGIYEFKEVVSGSDGSQDWITKYNLDSLTIKDEQGNERQEYVNIIVSSGEKAFQISLQYLAPEEIGTYVTIRTDQILGINIGIGYLADKGTIPFSAQNNNYQASSASTANFLSLLAQQYDVKDVYLSTGSIPDDVKTLIVASPTEYFSDYDLFLIDQFLMKGNNLAVFSESMDVMPYDMGGQVQYQFAPRNTGFEALLASYGIKMNNAFVMEEKGYKGMGQSETGAITENMYHNAFFTTDEMLNKKAKYLANTTGAMIQNVCSLDLSNVSVDQIPEIVIQTSKNSWEVSENISLEANANTMPEDASLLGPKIIAATVSGHFNSYFKGKTVEKPATAGDPAANNPLAVENKESVEVKGIDSTEQGKVFVFGSSIAIMDPYIDALGSQPNSRLVSNIIDHLSGLDAYAVMKSKGLSFGKIKEISAATKTFFKALNIILPIVLIGLCGLVLWIVWNKRKEKIRAEFSLHQTEGQA